MSVIKRLLRSVRWKALNKNCGVTMYISRKDAGELIFQHRQDAIADVRGEADFLLALLDGDDWSLVIKSHALIESLVTELIVSKIDQPTMKSFIERLPLSDNEIGKIRIAKDYGILSAGQRSFLKNFSELRNRLVHRVENINFKFLEYVANLDKNQKKSWQEAYTWFEREGDEGKESVWSAAAIDNPRWAVFMSVFMFVIFNRLSISEFDGVRKLELASKETMKRLFGGDSK
ncbi:hypothetical protein [Burkholderia glumae]|uniref:Uncharacterized protein n=1 Tax=Burkholderia glumae TaxID=337 RepID=A0AAP9Y2L8_BURGL|nr:hypothetical protein [Burkholderia glumae]MCM2538690.1 hypothetical protein [Burkholderia glumae]QPQ92990.1 hypothetical protein I6H06_11770 [Burkholderia glumae]QQM91808.1 hypothetical protein I6G78_05980 [Burkholderia glumae]USS44986.1 hypothetical protein NFI99_25640 [Burkholderia glumae]